MVFEVYGQRCRASGLGFSTVLGVFGEFGASALGCMAYDLRLVQQVIRPPEPRGTVRGDRNAGDDGPGKITSDSVTWKLKPNSFPWPQTEPVRRATDADPIPGSHDADSTWSDSQEEVELPEGCGRLRV